jgi:hypothetical protein
VSDNKSEDAQNAVLDLFTNQNIKVAYDREIRYRLEASFPHDVIGKAIDKLQRDKKLLKTGIPGRHGAAELPIQFYKLPQSDYKEILPIIRKKLDLSAFITGVANEMGRHAETAWWRAFKRNEWEVHPNSEEQPLGIKEYEGRRASTDHDIDFIAKKEGITYGIEVKNGLNYPDDLFWKFTVAVELQTIPLIIARWLNPGQVPLIRNLGGAGPLLFKDAIYSTTYSPLIEEVKQFLGSPISARDEIDDDYFQNKLGPIHDSVKNSHASRLEQMKDFALNGRLSRKNRQTLGDR